jgi:hypothetical protein
MDNKMEREYVKPSDFYWGIGLLTSVLFLILYYVSGELYFFILGAILFIVTLIIGHNKKIRNSFDYKKTKGGKK